MDTRMDARMVAVLFRLSCVHSPSIVMAIIKDIAIYTLYILWSENPHTVWRGTFPVNKT